MTGSSQKGESIRYRSLDALTQYELAGKIWRDMLERCAHGYFNSWGWISTWLSSLPAGRDIRLLVGYLNDEPVIACFVGRAKGLRYGFLPSRTLSLNSTGNDRYDQIFIEYNRVLISPHIEVDWPSLWSAAGRWNEFILPGLASDFVAAADLLESPLGDFRPITDKHEQAYWVDLQKIRTARMDYLSLLSSNRRSQIRRSLKEYEQDEKIHVREAADLAEALAMYEELISLHQREWKKRGRPGAFANSYFRDFHTKLIGERFAHGEIQLLRIGTDTSALGVLYNFIYNGNVLFYQSGFNYVNGNAHRPGLVSHYLAILHNAARGFNLYDFLAGEAQYKASLSTESVPMYWMRLVRGSTRFGFESAVLAMRQKLKSMPGLLSRIKSVRDWLRFRGV